MDTQVPVRGARARRSRALGGLLTVLGILGPSAAGARGADDPRVEALRAAVVADGERLPVLLGFAAKEARLAAALEADEALDRATPSHRGKRTPIVNRVPAYAAVVGEALARHRQTLEDGDFDLALALHHWLGSGEYVRRHGYDRAWTDAEPGWAPMVAVVREHGLLSDDVNEGNRRLGDRLAAGLARATGAVEAGLAPLLRRLAREGLPRAAGPGEPGGGGRYTFGPAAFVRSRADFRTDYRDRRLWVPHGTHMLLNLGLDANEGVYPSLAVSVTLDASLASELEPARWRMVDARGDLVRLEGRYATKILQFPRGRRTLAYAYLVEPRQDFGAAFADAVWAHLTSGGATPGSPPGPVTPRRLVLEAEDAVDLVPCDPAPPPSPCRARVVATLFGADGRPAPGVALAFDAPTLGRLDATSVTTDGAGTARVTYAAPTEDDLARRGVSVWSEVLRVTDATRGFEDDLLVTTRSRRGALLARAKHDVLPAADGTTTEVTVEARLAPKPGGEEYLFEVEATSGHGVLLAPGAGIGPRLSIRSGATGRIDLLYRWKGPQALAAPVAERVVVRVPERGLETSVAISVGVDLRVVSVRPRDAGPLAAFALTPLHVEVVDAFRPGRRVDLRRLFDDFGLEVPVRVLARSYAPPATDPGASGLERIRHRFRYDRVDVPPCAPWSVQATTVLHPLGAGGSERWVLAAKSPPEGMSAEGAYPGVHLLRRGTYGVAVELGPAAGDARGGEAPVDAAPLVVTAAESLGVELEETVFLPCTQVLLEILAAELHVGVEAALAARDVAAAIREGDAGSVFVAVWGFTVGRIAGKAGLSEVAKARVVANLFGGYAAAAAQGYADATAGERTGPAAKAAGPSRAPDPLEAVRAIVRADPTRAALVVERAGVGRMDVEGVDGVAWTAASERLFDVQDGRARVETTPAFHVVPLAPGEAARLRLDVRPAGARLALVTAQGTRRLDVPGPSAGVPVRAGADGTLAVEVAGPPPPWVRVEVARARRGARVDVTFRVPAGYDRTAWIGLIPSTVPHGRQRPNDDADVVYLALKGRTEGTLTFTIPASARPGRYEFRLFPSDRDEFEEAASSGPILIE